LLWTYIVANLGTRDEPGLLGPRARAELANALGAMDTNRLEVVRGARSTISEMRDTLVQAGLDTPKATQMLFSEFTARRSADVRFHGRSSSTHTPTWHAIK
jgi:hypothetical protein